MEVSPANRACGNAHEHLSPRRFWLWNLTKLQRLFRSLQNHRAHIDLSKIARGTAQLKRLLDAGANRFETRAGDDLLDGGAGADVFWVDQTGADTDGQIGVDAGDFVNAGPGQDAMPDRQQGKGD